MLQLITGQILLITFASRLLISLLNMRIISILILLFGVVYTLENMADELIYNPSVVSHGSLLVSHPTGNYRQLPLLDTQVDIKISGLIARAAVKQYFQTAEPTS